MEDRIKLAVSEIVSIWKRHGDGVQIRINTTPSSVTVLLTDGKNGHDRPAAFFNVDLQQLTMDESIIRHIDECMKSRLGMLGIEYETLRSFKNGY